MQLEVIRTIAFVIAFCISNSVSAENLVIGQVAPLGSPDSPGNQLRIGAQLYFDAVNASGGIHGMSLKLVSKDRGLKAEDVVSKTRELIQESDPVALLGFLGTGPTEALVKSDLLTQTGLSVVGIRTGAVSLHEPTNPYLFHTRVSYASEIQKILTQLTTIGLNRVGVFYENSAFGKEGLALVEHALKAKPSMQLVAQAAYEPGTANVHEAVTSFVKTNPQGIISVANSAATAEFYKEYRQRGESSQVLALSVVDSSDVVKRIGARSAKGLIVTQVVPDPTNSTIPIIKEMQKNLTKFGPSGIGVNQTIAEGYLAAKVLVEAIRVAGPNPTRRKLRTALESMKYFDAGGVIIAFSPANHSGSRYAELAILLKSGMLMR